MNYKDKLLGICPVCCNFIRIAKTTSRLYPHSTKRKSIRRFDDEIKEAGGGEGF